MSIYSSMVREAELRGELVVYGHPVWNGRHWVRVFSCSRANPFAGADVPTEVILPGPRVNVRQLVEKIHQLAPQVAAAYGEESVGALPKRKRTKHTKRAA